MSKYDHDLKLVGGDEFLESMKHESKDWIIPGLALPGSALMLYARQGEGKSRFMAQLASALIYGTPFMGLPILKTGKIISLQLDMPPEEWDLLHSDARDEKLGLDSSNFLTLHKDNDYFDIDDPQMEEWLCDMYATHKPIAFMLDSIKDAFSQSPGRNEDINKFALKRLKKFRRCCPKSLFMYALHDRKSPARIKEEDIENDKDSYGEVPAYARFASTIIRLFTNKEEETKMYIHKDRLGGVGWKKLQITMNNNGFFLPTKMTHQLMLMSWPHFIPAAERNAAITAAKTCQDVYRDIAHRAMVPEGTVKKVAQRAPLPYLWEKLL